MFFEPFLNLEAARFFSMICIILSTYPVGLLSRTKFMIFCLL